uniref:Uncharacterized protein n=1 Tax=Alexandrium monilatum TaxID=311494 RepID=A0A7S4SGQ9_9DINO
MKKTFVNKGAVRDGVRSAAAAGSWDSESDLFKLMLQQPRCKDANFWDFLRQYRREEAELLRLRDEALDARGAGKRGHVPPGVNCPGRHGAATFFAWDDGFSCSLCEGVIAQGSQCLGCRLCDHDVCTACIRRLWPSFQFTPGQDGVAEAPGAGAGSRRRRRKGKAAAKAAAAGVEQRGPRAAAESVAERAVVAERVAGLPEGEVPGAAEPLARPGAEAAEDAPAADGAAPEPPDAALAEAPPSEACAEAEAEAGARGPASMQPPDRPRCPSPAKAEVDAVEARGEQPEAGVDVRELAEARSQADAQSGDCAEALADGRVA